MKTLIENRQKSVKLDLRRIRRTVREAAKHLGCPERELSILFVDNAAIAEINRQYLNRPGPTNVISFSQTEGDSGQIDPVLLGDIVISAERAASDAEAGNLDVKDEIDFLLIHGNGVKDPDRIAEMVRQTRQVEGYRPMPILFNEDDHFDFDKPVNNMWRAIESYASWGYFDPGESNYRDGYQCPPVHWGINTDRKRAFFAKVKEITGA